MSDVKREMEERLYNLSWVVNRSFNQTKQLFELCDNDFDKLLELEAKIKEHHVGYCPGSKESVVAVLSLKP